MSIRLDVATYLPNAEQQSNYSLFRLKTCAYSTLYGNLVKIGHILRGCTLLISISKYQIQIISSGKFGHKLRGLCQNVDRF